MTTSSDSSNVSGLPGLESLGQKTADDASSRGITLIAPKLDIPEGGYKAIEHLPKDVKVDTVRSDAKKLNVPAPITNARKNRRRSAPQIVSGLFMAR